jgi:NAD(P)-dependent dehydrogenase (short-subunit alcohol dehydrogenase family)
MAADLYDPSTPDNVAAQNPDIDIVVYNANTPSGGSLEALPDEQWMHNWPLKPFGYIRMLRAFVPVLRTRGGGVGINSWVVNTERNVAAFSERAQDRFGDAKRWPELHANLPFKRAAEPSEVGDLVAFITSSRASYLSGQVISLDGGYVASSLPTMASGALAQCRVDQNVRL